MVSPVVFSSATEEWSTPQGLFDDLDAEFRFVLDAAATHENTKCRAYYTKAQNGLQQAWARDVEEFGGGAIFCNPPYGRGITGQWVAKAASEARGGVTVVCLLPARTDNRWWHTYVEPVRIDRPGDVRFIQGRLKFGGAKHGAPFPSVVVVFRGSMLTSASTTD